MAFQEEQRKGHIEVPSDGIGTDLCALMQNSGHKTVDIPLSKNFGH